MSVPLGVAAYRTELRRKGGILALGVAAVVALSGGVLLVLPGRITGVSGFALVIAACPLLVAFGVPITAGANAIVLGVGSSLALWFVLGQLAAHRATRRPVADWKDWRSVMLPFSLAMVLGGFAGFALFALSVL